jgi:alpha-L-glutamate ligase-like protein
MNILQFLINGNKVLGMNSRNLQYVRPYNKKRARRLADEKLYSKRVLHKNGIAVPALLGRIRNYEELENFNWNSLPGGFALKPNRGFGGEGILVVFARKKNRPDAWIKADGSMVTIEDLKAHIRNILDGSFSLANTPDVAFFEERLKLHKFFKPYSFKGIPDIRVIVFNRVPVMAMLRLPTRASSGKANLQQGAIGVGIDLATGITTSAIYGKGHPIEYVPDSELLLSGMKIPHWKEILYLSAKAQEISGLGFLGADIAIDRDHGPVIIELNARPGLSIQLANSAGLKERLERVSGIKIKSVARGIRVGMDLFGGEIEEEIEEISGKRVIGAYETVTFTGINGKTIDVLTKIDTGADSTSIDTELAHELGYQAMLDEFQSRQNGRDVLAELTQKERARLFAGIEHLAGKVPVNSSHGTSYRPMINTNLILGGESFNTRVSIIDRGHLRYKAIIGAKNLGQFYIDVTKGIL